MKNFIKTIINSVQSWTKKQIRQSAADWNENNPNVDSYVKNRPFYEEDGVIHKLDPKYLPDDIGVQPDWNEMDESSKAYIWNKPDVALRSDLESLKNGIVLADTVQGIKYMVQIQDGNLVSRLIASLDDFYYTTNSDGTYTITDWKQTYLGEPSTILVVPDDSNIIL